MISIVICFYDNDIECIPHMVDQLYKLTFDKEVIFVDDRKDKSKYLEFGDYKCITHEGNIGIFESRRQGALASKGDYIWFVDIDDNLFDYKPIEDGSDVICYNFRYNNNNVYRFKENRYFTFQSFKNRKYAYVYLLYGSLWRNNYKRDFLLKVYDKIPEYKNLFFYEDMFLNGFVLNNMTRITCNTQIIYDYQYTYDYAFTDNPDKVKFIIDHSRGDAQKILHIVTKM